MGLGYHLTSEVPYNGLFQSRKFGPEGGMLSQLCANYKLPQLYHSIHVCDCLRCFLVMTKREWSRCRKLSVMTNSIARTKDYPNQPRSTKSFSWTEVFRWHVFAHFYASQVQECSGSWVLFTLNRCFLCPRYSPVSDRSHLSSAHKNGECDCF